MRVLFLTQSSSLAMFTNLAEIIGSDDPASKVGFYIADSSYFNSYMISHPEFTRKYSQRLCEWDILEKAAKSKADLAYLREKEKEFGDGTLWNSIIADRRLFMGSRAAYRQDLGSRYSHDELLSIVDSTVRELERFIAEFKPDIVVSFICVTIGEYVTSLICKRDGIRFINLRPTRIENYFFGAEDVHEPSELLESEYKKVLSGGVSGEAEGKVDNYLSFVRKEHGLYEGVIPAKGAGKVSLHRSGKTSLMTKVLSALHMLVDQFSGKYKYDNHYVGIFGPAWFKWVVKPARLAGMRFFHSGYVAEDDMSAMNFVYYPLHKEPEVTLLVYSNAYLDQLDVIRRLARSLPLGMSLFVKEHPACMGYRPLEYYRELLMIPNVRLISPDVESRRVIEKAKLTAIVSGSSGFEAIILKKPVIALGHVPFEFLPDSMLKKVDNIEELSADISWLLENHDYSEEAMRAYVAAVMNLSVPVDFYSRLLGRSNVYREGDDSEGAQETVVHLERLAKYITSG